MPYIIIRIKHSHWNARDYVQPRRHDPFFEETDCQMKVGSSPSQNVQSRSLQQHLPIPPTADVQSARGYNGSDSRRTRSEGLLLSFGWTALQESDQRCGPQLGSIAKEGRQSTFLPSSQACPAPFSLEQSTQHRVTVSAFHLHVKTLPYKFKCILHDLLRLVLRLVGI